MKNYIKPQINIRNIQLKHYMVGQSNLEVTNAWDGTGDHAQLTKDRDEIWNPSDSEEESIW